MQSASKGFDSGSRTCLAADERRYTRIRSRARASFYHPFAALSRATEDTEEKLEKTFKAWALGLNPRTGSWFKISSVFICVHLRQKKVVDFERSGW